MYLTRYTSKISNYHSTQHGASLKIISHSYLFLSSYRLLPPTYFRYTSDAIPGHSSRSQSQPRFLLACTTHVRDGWALDIRSLWQDNLIWSHSIKSSYMYFTNCIISPLLANTLNIKIYRRGTIFWYDKNDTKHALNYISNQYCWI
jgi:hypothetical protein